MKDKYIFWVSWLLCLFVAVLAGFSETYFRVMIVYFVGLISFLFLNYWATYKEEVKKINERWNK